MSPENISEHFGESHHCQNLKFENFGKFQQKMESPGLIWERISVFLKYFGKKESRWFLY